MDAKKVLYVSRDAISSLPDEILAQILCLLPTKRAASTIILSKRWRNLFTFMVRYYTSQHHLEFDDSDFLYPNKQRTGNVRESFRALVDSTLSLSPRHCSSIKKLSLKFRDDLDHFRAHTNRWISNALARGVSDLDLDITMRVISNPRTYDSLLPSIVFRRNTLVKLTLGTCLCLGYVPLSQFCFPVLKSLFLYTVWFSGHAFADVVVPFCPVLEELYINHKHIDHLEWSGPYLIRNQTLKRITIHLDYRRRRFAPTPGFTFNTPNLVYLDYSDRIDKREFGTADFLHSLVQARLDLVLASKNPGSYSKLISWIRNVQTLYLSSDTVEVMWQCLVYWRDNGGFPMFNNLVNLSFECKIKYGWRVLWNLIENSPKLETLILKGFGCVRNCGISIDGNVVKMLEIYGYGGTGREWSQVKKFLWEMEFLEVMKVEVDGKVDEEKKLQVTNDLLALPKRSSNCQIHFL